MRDVALDACCLINLCAAGSILSVQSCSRLGLRLHIPNEVAAETLYILQPDADDAGRLVKHPIDLGWYTAASLLRPCALEGSDELELFVEMATRLGDGEAACFAVAAQRGWILATDDRRARRLAAEAALTVMTTPELVKHWSETTHAGHQEIAAVLRSIQERAYFAPRAGAPEADWWARCLGKAG